MGFPDRNSGVAHRPFWVPGLAWGSRPVLLAATRCCRKRRSPRPPPGCGLQDPAAHCRSGGSVWGPDIPVVPPLPFPPTTRALSSRLYFWRQRAPHSACLLNELIFNQKLLSLIMSCAINIHFNPADRVPRGGAPARRAPPPRGAPSVGAERVPGSRSITVCYERAEPLNSTLTAVAGGD